MINIGMTIGLAPVIGIPLPFFSYGGSSSGPLPFCFSFFIKLDLPTADLKVVEYSFKTVHFSSDTVII